MHLESVGLNSYMCRITLFSYHPFGEVIWKDTLCLWLVQPRINTVLVTTMGLGFRVKKKIFEILNGNNEKADGKGVTSATFKEHHVAESYYKDT